MIPVLETKKCLAMNLIQNDVCQKCHELAWREHRWIMQSTVNTKSSLDTKDPEQEYPSEKDKTVSAV